MTALLRVGAFALFTLVFGSTYASGQKLPTNQPLTNSPTEAAEGADKAKDSFFEKIGEQAAESVYAWLGLLIVYLWQKRKLWVSNKQLAETTKERIALSSERESLVQKNNDLHKSLRLHFTDKPPIERTQTVLVLGDSRTGKTTFIKNLFGFPTDQKGAPNPRRPTADVHLYGLVHETKTASENRVHRFDIVDYRGSELASLVKSWPDLQSEMLHTKATAVILILECFDATNSDEAPLKFSSAHLASQVANWSSGKLSVLSATVADEQEPPLVILFANKADLLLNMTLPRLSQGTGEQLAAVKSILGALESALQTAFSGVEIHTIIGSLTHGVGINAVTSLLLDNSKTIET